MRMRRTPIFFRVRYEPSHSTLRMAVAETPETEEVSGSFRNFGYDEAVASLTSTWGRHRSSTFSLDEQLSRDFDSAESHCIPGIAQEPADSTGRVQKKNSRLCT